MSPSLPRLRRVPLALRLFLLVAALLAAALGAAVSLSLLQGSRITDRAVERALQASADLQAAFTSQRLKELELITQLIAVDAAFVHYIADAQANAAGSLVSGRASIHDLLLERQQSYGFSLGMVLDDQGEILARSDQPEALQQSLADDPFIAAAIESLQPVSGFWRDQETLLQAALFPLARGDALVGFLLLCEHIDDALGQRVRQVSDADIAFVLPDDADAFVIVGSSLDDAHQTALRRALADPEQALARALHSSAGLDRTLVELDGQPWVARLTPLDPDAGAAVGAALQLKSYAEAASGYRSLLNTVGLTGLAALLVSLPLSLLLARASLQPLRQLAAAAQNAAAGNYQARFAPQGKDELAALGRALDSLLSDLRGERDMEAYVTHLSRLMPEPGDLDPDAGEPLGLPPQSGSRVLLAIDADGLLQPAGRPLADAQVGAAAQALTGIALLAREHGGQWVGQAGSHLLLAFAGEQASSAALLTLRELLVSAPEVRTAASAGELLTGSVRGEGLLLPLALGEAATQALRLLALSQPGRCVLDAALARQLCERFGEQLLGEPLANAKAPSPRWLAADALPNLARGPAAPPRLSGAGEGFCAVTLGAAAHADGGHLLAGSVLGGRYRILSLLGSGGMGVVYRARDLELDDVVALKMLKGAALRDPEQLERLKSEIRLARRITHPNVLRTFDFGEFDGSPFISMEYVRGMTLRYLLQQAGRVPFTAALRLARQLCAGLQAAHEVGVLHRDIKPENLILEASGNAKLMDFGIARPLRADARTEALEDGVYLGTPAYSAPEQLTGKPIDPRTDLYAAGALMMELFCGQPPYPGESMEAIYRAQREGALRQPAALAPGLPLELQAILLRCLRLDPAERYPSAEALAAELARVRA
jgi:serine/threonine-protein kinase